LKWSAKYCDCILEPGLGVSAAHPSELVGDDADALGHVFLVIVSAH